MVKFLLKVIPFLFWLATVWQYFMVFLTVFSFLLTGQLNKPDCQSVILRFFVYAFALTVLSLLVHVLCRKYYKYTSH